VLPDAYIHVTIINSPKRFKDCLSPVRLSSEPYILQIDLRTWKTDSNFDISFSSIALKIINRLAPLFLSIQLNIAIHPPNAFRQKLCTALVPFSPSAHKSLICQSTPNLEPRSAHTMEAFSHIKGVIVCNISKEHYLTNRT
jgi:hypothetical protein